MSLSTSNGKESSPPTLPLKRPPKRKPGPSKLTKCVSSHHDPSSQLLDAVLHEKPRVVRRLLDSRADPNVTGGKGETSLMIACQVQGEEERRTIVDLLLHKGADVNIQDSWGQTALMKAVLQNDMETVEKLLLNRSNVALEDSNGDCALCHAASSGSVGMTKVMVAEFTRRKLNVDRKNMRGLTPLLLACQDGNIEVARILVQEGGASGKIRDLDNFMTAEEWMKLTGFYSDAELNFLSPSAQKKNYYRKQRQLKGIKTLADFLPESPEKVPSPVGSPNVFALRKQPARKEAGRLPGLSEHSQPPGGPASSLATSSRSMFDIPPASKQQPQASSKPGFSLGKPVPKPQYRADAMAPFSTVKKDLYHSPYMDKRECYVSKDRRSGFYHRGSLEPLGFEVEQRLRDLASAPDTSRSSKKKHNALPPLKHRRGSNPV